MSRSGYVDGCDVVWDKHQMWKYIRWRGAVSSAIKGKRGQAFLRELLKALDEMPVKELITEKLECSGKFCALGAVGNSRGLDMSRIDVGDQRAVAKKLDVAHSLACEIMHENDDPWDGPLDETGSQRWKRVRQWVAEQITAGESDEHL